MEPPPGLESKVENETRTREEWYYRSHREGEMREPEGTPSRLVTQVIAATIVTVLPRADSLPATSYRVEIFFVTQVLFTILVTIAIARFLTPPSAASGVAAGGLGFFLGLAFCYLMAILLPIPASIYWRYSVLKPLAGDPLVNTGQGIKLLAPGMGLLLSWIVPLFLSISTGVIITRILRRREGMRVTSR